MDFKKRKCVLNTLQVLTNITLIQEVHKRELELSLEFKDDFLKVRTWFFSWNKCFVHVVVRSDCFSEVRIHN